MGIKVKLARSLKTKIEDLEILVIMYIIDHYENTEFQSSFYSPNLIWFGEVLVFSNWSKDTLSLKFLTAIFNEIVKNNLMKLFSTYFVYWETRPRFCTIRYLRRGLVKMIRAELLISAVITCGDDAWIPPQKQVKSK